MIVFVVLHNMALVAPGLNVGVKIFLGTKLLKVELWTIQIVKRFSALCIPNSVQQVRRLVMIGE